MVHMILPGVHYQECITLLSYKYPRSLQLLLRVHWDVNNSTSWTLRDKYGTNHEQHPPRLRLPNGVGVGSTPSLSFFLRLPGSSLPHGVGTEPLLLPKTPWLEPPSWRRRRVSPSSRDSLARASLMASAPSVSLFWRIPRKSSSM